MERVDDCSLVFPGYATNHAAQERVDVILLLFRRQVSGETDDDRVVFEQRTRVPVLGPFYAMENFPVHCPRV
jgi:hypothetical protein